MKKLMNLNEEIKTIQGIPVADLDQKGIMTVRKAFITVCEMHKPQKSGEATEVLDMALKFNAAKKGFLEVSDSDLELLKRVVNETEVFRSLVIGKLLEVLDGKK